MRPTPTTLRPRTDRAVSRLDAMWKNWRWSRRLGNDRLRTTDEALVSTGSFSNPTQGTVLAQQVIREMVRQGEKALVEATVAFEKADWYFEQALIRADNRSPETRELDLPQTPWVSKKEHHKLEKAQRRRAERGEDVP